MKNLSLTLIGLLYVLMVQANADVPFSIQGIRSGDNVTVTISSNSYLEAMTVTADGDYSFLNVPAGKHSVKIEIAGYNLPAAQTVVVNGDGTVQPMTGIKLAITKMSDNPNEWTHSWKEDGSVAGYTTTAYVNTPPTVEFLGKKIVPSDVSSSSILYNRYHVILSDEGDTWTQEYAYRMLETFKTICAEVNGDEGFSKFVLTSNSINDDVTIEKDGESQIVTLSKDVFYYANPFLVNLDGVRGRFFSKRLHHALVNYYTDYGRNRDKANEILSWRFGCSIYPPSYEELTRGITNETEANFQEFIPSELVSIINMFEELPEGFHKTPHLNYLIRRQNGHKHPLYPEAAAVSWCVDNGYIEFMESTFGGNNQQFETLRLILHEKTHFLWAFSFSEEIKNDWIEIGGWYKDPNAAEEWSTTKDTEFVSAYAHAKNPNEDMAESVAFYLKNPEKLQSRSLPKYEFIRDRIMHGTRYISKIPDHLTFEVLNLYPDYDYPGKIKRLDVKVIGAPDEDKTVIAEIELNHIEGFEDGASNAFTRISGPLFMDNGEKKSQWYDMWFYPVDGNPYILRGEITVSKYSKMGYWTAGDIVVSDLQGNQRFEGRNDCVWNMYVNNPLEDLEAPRYEKGSLKYELSESTLDGHHIQNLHVSYKATDNMSINKCIIRLSAGIDAYSWDDLYGTYDAETQTTNFDFPIKDFFRTSDYYVESLTIWDTAGTETYVQFSEDPNDEPIQKIHVTTPNPDTEAPEVDLNRITVYAEPTNKEAPDGETLVTINYYARDDKAGLGKVDYRLKDPQGIDHFEYHYHRNYSSNYFDGDPTVWEKYTINCVLPKGSAPGIWGLAELSVSDKAWNGRTYNFVETLIFEPDDSETDYVLFANLEDNDMLNLSLTSETLNGYGYTYRIISDENGQELNGSLTAEQRARTRSAAHYDKSIDISSLPDGKIIVIVNVVDVDNKVMAVRSQSLVKSSGPTGIESRIDKTNGNVTSITYFDAMGRQLNAPVKGLNIVKVMYENGTVKAMKINKD